MRVFDGIGIIAVATWVVIVGAFVFVGSDQGDALGISLSDGEIDMREETVWMTVYRAGDEVGVLREDRTLLVDGWLVEVQGIVELNLMGDGYAFRFVSRSTLDEALTLRSATASVEAFGMALEMSGQLRSTDDGAEFHVTIHLDEAAERFVADLEQAPHLAMHAIPRMLASEELSEESRYEQEFFDPLTLSPSTISIVYEGRDEIVNMDGDYVDAYAFRQDMGAFSSEIRTDERGMVIQQVLPMQIAIARLPEPLGRNLFRDLEAVFEERRDKAPPFVEAIDADDLLALVSRFGSGRIDRLTPVDATDADILDTASAPRSRQFVIGSLADFEELDLMSPRQRVAFQTPREARVEVSADNPLWHAGMAPRNSNYAPRDRAENIPQLEALIAALDEALELDSDRIDHGQFVELLKTHCSPLDDLSANVVDNRPWPTEPSGPPEFPIDCLALAADALAHLEFAPHFVHGAYADPESDEIAARVWLALYRDGHYRGDIDLLSDTGQVGPDHIQLYIDESYRPQRLPTIVDAIAVH